MNKRAYFIYISSKSNPEIFKGRAILRYSLTDGLWISKCLDVPAVGYGSSINKAMSSLADAVIVVMGFAKTRKNVRHYVSERDLETFSGLHKVCIEQSKKDERYI